MSKGTGTPGPAASRLTGATAVPRRHGSWRSRRRARRGARPRRVLAIVGEQEVTVVALDTGEILSVHRIEPDKGHRRNTRRDHDLQAHRARGTRGGAPDRCWARDENPPSPGR